MAKGIKEGDEAPDFELPNQEGKMIRLSDIKGQRALVLYFYPKDFTSGCTMEARAFRDMYEEFQRQEAEVVGVSGDSIQSHKEFIEAHQLPFMLLSDAEGRVRDLYGAYSIGKLPGRVTYLIDKEGIVRMVLSTNINPKKHIDEALRVLREINAGQPALKVPS
jgi:peroxiredoxin Q/BCP